VLPEPLQFNQPVAPVFVVIRRKDNQLCVCFERGIDGKSFPVREYQRLWEEINGAVSWASNPWVWVVEFRKVEGGAQ
jgi:hypothetical protein